MRIVFEVVSTSEENPPRVADARRRPRAHAGREAFVAGPFIYTVVIQRQLLTIVALSRHGRPRPISLKSDVIKSRNRVKTSQPKKRDGQDGLLATNGYAAAHPDAAHAAPLAPGGINGHQHGFPMGSMTGHIGDPSPNSRGNTPSLHQQQSNHHIAPQHIFDTVSLPSDTFASPSLPAFNLR